MPKQTRSRKSDNSLKGSDEPIPLTPEGLRRLETRLARLKASLPDLISETARTAAYGDRSDSAEYKDAKMSLRRTHGQIWNIEDQLKRVVLIAAGADEDGRARLGSRVTVMTSTGEHRTFEILGSSESKPREGRISHSSPLGAALLNKAAGETVTVETPKGPEEYRILEVA